MPGFIPAQLKGKDMHSIINICDTKIRTINFKLLPLKHSKLIRETCIECFEKYNIQDGLKSGDFKLENIELSKRLKVAAGSCNVRLVANRNNTATKYQFEIKLAYNNYIEFGIESTIKTLRHELSHMIEIIKYGSTGHTERFKKICFDLGGSMNTEMAGKKYASCATDNFCKQKNKYTYQCSCGASFYRQHRVTSPKTLRGTCRTCGTLLMDMKLIVN